MLLRYQIEGLENQEWNLSQIPQERIHNNQVSFSAIKKVLEEDEIETGQGFSIKYYDRKNDGWFKARNTTMIPAIDEVKIKVTPCIKEDSQDIQKQLADVQAQLQAQTHVTRSNVRKDSGWGMLSNAAKTRPRKGMMNLKGQSMKNVYGRRQSISNQHAFEEDSYEEFGDMPPLPTLGQHPTMSRQMSVMERQQIQDELDMVIFHSAPLIDIVNKVATPLQDSTLDFESERRQIIDTLQINDIGVSIRFDAATVEKLIEVLAYNPKIIHISCHGAYDPNMGNQFYLAFEQSKPLGLLDRLTTERLTALLGPFLHKTSECVVFVSAWYSGAIGSVFRDAGFPCVICVNSQCQILDDAAQLFASTFYRCILKGSTIASAYETAIVLVKDQQASLVQGCCCSHNHSINCKWYALHSTMTAEEMHKEHVPTCTYCPKKASGIHRVDCKWAEQFMSKYDPDRLPTEEEFEANEILVCCCQPDAPHGEGAKFNMICDESFLQKRLFEEGSNSLEIENVAPLPEHLRPPHVHQNIVGRHIEIQHLVEILKASGSKNRRITVCGESGIGKSVVVKMAAMYAFERRAFQDGVLYLDLRHKTNLDSIYVGIADSYGIPGKISQKELNRCINKLQLLIILENCSSLIEQQEQEFNEKIGSIMDFTQYPKFLIVTQKPPVHAVGEVITLEDLELEPWTTMVKSMVSEECSKEIAEKAQVLKTFMGGNPGQVEALLPILQGKGVNEFIVMRQKEELSTCPHFAIRTVLQLIYKDHPDALPFLQLLLEFPGGILESDLELLWEDKPYNQKELIEALIGGKGAHHRQFLVQIGDSGKVEEEIYIASDKFKLPALEIVENRDVYEEKRNEAIIYLGALARGILRTFLQTSEYDTGIEMDSQHINFNASLCIGIWADLDEEWSKKIQEKIEHKLPVERFRLIEINFWHHLKLFAETPPILTKPVADALHELIICVCSIYILQGRYEEAIEYGKQAEKCSQALDHPKTTATIQLITASVFLLMQNTKKARNYVNKANQGFKTIKSNEGKGECSLLLAQISALTAKMNEKDDESPEQTLDSNVDDPPPTLQLRRSNSLRVRKISHQSLEFDLAVEDYYDQSYKYFTRANAQCGVARQLILKSEFLIRNPKQLTLDISLVKSFLKGAKSIVEFFKDPVWQLRCVVTFARYYKRKRQWNKAREKYKTAKALAKNNKDRKQEIFIKDEIHRINHEISKASVNNISILIGNPLVRVTGTGYEEIESIGPVCRQHNSNHLSRMIEEMSKCNKVVNVKVDYLNRNSLKQVDSGSRILILDSDAIDENALIVEGPCQEADFIPIEHIKNLLGHDFKGVDVVLFAMPQSRKLAQYFYENLGVNHAIAFDFPSITQSEDHGHFSLLVRKVVFNFCIQFYTLILQTHTVKQAMKMATKKVTAEFLQICEMYEQDASNLDKFGPVLIDPENACHLSRIFSDREVSLYSNIAMVAFGKVLNVSRSLPPTNLKAIETFLSGRQIDMYTAIQSLTTTPIVQVIGESGLGKTHFLQVLAHFVHMRNIFSRGVFFFDLEKCNTMGTANSEFDKAGISSKAEEKQNLLLILDNCDKLIKENISSFTTLLKFYVEECGFKILLSSKQELMQQRMTVAIQSTEIYLDKLSDMESATLVAINSRPLKKEEVTTFNTKESLLSLLAKSEGLSACKGNPGRLMRMAENLENETFQDIQKRTNLADNILKQGFGRGFGFNRLKPKKKTDTPSIKVSPSLSFSQVYSYLGSKTFNPKKATPKLNISREQEKQYDDFKSRISISGAADVMKNSSSMTKGILKVLFSNHAGAADQKENAVHFNKNISEEESSNSNDTDRDSFSSFRGRDKPRGLTLDSREPSPLISRETSPLISREPSPLNAKTIDPSQMVSQGIQEGLEAREGKRKATYTRNLIAGIREQKKLIADKEAGEKRKTEESKVPQPLSLSPQKFFPKVSLTDVAKPQIKVFEPPIVTSQDFGASLGQSSMMSALVSKIQVAAEEPAPDAIQNEETKSGGFLSGLGSSSFMSNLVKEVNTNEEEELQKKADEEKAARLQERLSKVSWLSDMGKKKAKQEVEQKRNEDEEQEGPGFGDAMSKSLWMGNLVQDVQTQGELEIQRKQAEELKNSSLTSSNSNISAVVQSMRNSQSPQNQRGEERPISSLNSSLTRSQMMGQLLHDIQRLEQEGYWREDCETFGEEEPVVFLEPAETSNLRNITISPAFVELSERDVVDRSISPREMRQEIPQQSYGYRSLSPFQSYQAQPRRSYQPRPISAYQSQRTSLYASRMNSGMHSPGSIQNASFSSHVAPHGNVRAPRTPSNFDMLKQSIKSNIAYLRECSTESRQGGRKSAANKRPSSSDSYSSTFSRASPKSWKDLKNMWNTTSSRTRSSRQSNYRTNQMNMTTATYDQGPSSQNKPRTLREIEMLSKKKITKINRWLDIQNRNK